ncbi:MAG TPA: organic hydroperoxide resistance protein [Williamwhitmania sp.]|nr:organic hydroperoxide resistance protein [Williamwhitmania sp.]
METQLKKYTAVATATGGRNGVVKSSDGILDFKVSVPKDLGGEGGAHTNPDQLFASGWAACFDNALISVIGARKLNATSQTTVEVTLGLVKEGGLGLSAKLLVKIDGIDHETGQKLMEAAHKVCPYSKATRNNIEVELTLLS